MHGERALLERAFAAIAARAGASPYRVVMLGDYVDRGPDSAGVIRLLRDREADGHLLCLKGNHEAILLKAVDTGNTDHWFRNGGRETLASYDGAVDPDDAAWLRQLPFAFADRHRIFVHGGLKPNVPLREQDEESCMWIRDVFLKAPGDTLPAHVVHGHTPSWAAKTLEELPERLPHRTNLDTAAFATGRLTIGLFETGRPGGAIEIIQVSRLALPAPAWLAASGTGRIGKLLRYKFANLAQSVKMALVRRTTAIAT